MVIKEVKSDTELELTEAVIGQELENYEPYYRIPKMNSAAIYNSVWT